MDIEIVSSIEIASGQEITFTQPKYHFGQWVVDKSEDAHGIVRGMEYDEDDGWEYSLFYPELGVIGRNIREDKLTEIVNT